MRDEDDRVPARPDQVVERLLHEGLALGVERTGEGEGKGEGEGEGEGDGEGEGEGEGEVKVM